MAKGITPTAKNDIRSRVRILRLLILNIYLSPLINRFNILKKSDNDFAKIVPEIVKIMEDLEKSRSINGYKKDIGFHIG